MVIKGNVVTKRSRDHAYAEAVGYCWSRVAVLA
jgi:hypothetical protein